MTSFADLSLSRAIGRERTNPLSKLYSRYVPHLHRRGKVIAITIASLLYLSLIWGVFKLILK